MPELPEVETITTGLNKVATNLPIINVIITNESILVPKSKNIFIKHLTNDTILSFTRKGKYIKIKTASNWNLVVHLRMTGQLFIADSTYQKDKHVHIELQLSNKQTIVYRDIRKFGKWILVSPDQDLNDYINAGVDALSLTQNILIQLMNSYPNKKLKAFLLDQKIIAGIGNIYADEICFDIKSDPETLIRKVNYDKLHRSILAILQLAIKNKGTSVSDYLDSTGARGNFQNLLTVYKQENCPQCNAPISKKKVAGRTSHYCKNCQN